MRYHELSLLNILDARSPPTVLLISVLVRPGIWKFQGFTKLKLTVSAYNLPVCRFKKV